MNEKPVPPPRCAAKAQFFVSTELGVMQLTIAKNSEPLGVK